MKKLFFLALMLLFTLDANSLNIKREKAGAVTTLIDDPTCSAQYPAQGQAGNVRVICTETTEAPPPPTFDCAPLNRVDFDIQRHYDAPGLSFADRNMTGMQAYVMRFKTGDASPNTNMMTTQEYAGDVVARYPYISESPCDFSVPPGYALQGTTTRTFFTVGVQVDGIQTLKPNTQYYVNLKNEDVVAAPGINDCPTICGFVLTFYR